MKSLNKEAKVENKSYERLFEPILIWIVVQLYSFWKKNCTEISLEITDSAGADIEIFSWLIVWPSNQRKFWKLTCHTFIFAWLRKFVGYFVVATAAGAAAEERQPYV